MNLKLTLLLFILTVFQDGGLPKNIQKKVDKELTETFSTSKYQFKSVKVPTDVAKGLPSAFGSDNFFKVQANTTLLGYAYVSKAPSKTDEFDYLVILSPELKVMHTKVLIYREDYGGEIGSTRWLKQFTGKTQDDALRYGDNIMAIAGATISVRSMTAAMNDLLKSLKILHSQNII